MDVSRPAEAIAEIVSKVGIIYPFICLTGPFVLGVWLLRTSLGRKSLVDSPMRRNNLPAYLALAPLFVWSVVFWALGTTKEKMLGALPDWQDALAGNVIICIGAIPAVITGIVLAKIFFARRLKGFGLNPATIGRDFAAALVNLLAIMPVVLAIIAVTTLVGQLVVGPEFEMPRHEELKQIIAYPQWQLRALIFLTSIVVVPVAEEMIFRGMIQTALRSFIVRPWPAIVFASVIFVIFHANPQHWPALFAFSMCLGYTYEKSGSLFRCIFLHSMFNALSVINALQSPWSA